MKTFRIVARYKDTHCDVIVAQLPDHVDHGEILKLASEIFFEYYYHFYHLIPDPEQLEINITAA